MWISRYAMWIVSNWHKFFFVVLQCTNCKFRTTRSWSMNCSSLVKIQLLPIKSILFSIEKWIINVEFLADNYSSTWKYLRTKIPPMDSVFTEIQIWQSKLARQNILDSRKCLLVLNRSRITKQNSKRICCCWDNRESPKKWTAWQEATCPGNRSLGFTPRKVFGLCGRSRVLSRSGKSKRGSNATSGCRENWELLCLATGWEEASVSTINLSFLNNHWPLSSPVSCFRTDLTCINAYKGRKHSAAWITLCVFGRVPPQAVLCTRTVNLSFLSNRWSHSSPVSCFRTDSTCLNALDGRKHSTTWIALCDFELDSPLLCHVGITVIFKYLSKSWPFLISVSLLWLEIHSLNAHIV